MKIFQGSKVSVQFLLMFFLPTNILFYVNFEQKQRKKKEIWNSNAKCHTIKKNSLLSYNDIIDFSWKSWTLWNIDRDNMTIHTLNTPKHTKKQYRRRKNSNSKFSAWYDCCGLFAINDTIRRQAYAHTHTFFLFRN